MYKPTFTSKKLAVAGDYTFPHSLASLWLIEDINDFIETLETNQNYNSHAGNTPYPANFNTVKIYSKVMDICNNQLIEFRQIRDDYTVFINLVLKIVEWSQNISTYTIYCKDRLHRDIMSMIYARSFINTMYGLDFGVPDDRKEDFISICVEVIVDYLIDHCDHFVV